MSPSGLHHHFKTLTNMPPLQYQKHLRLQEARQLMLAEAMDASAAAYHVGYAAAHSSPVNTPVSSEPCHFGMSSRFGSNLSQQNYEAVPPLF
jgi:methylphosphotriester-DNA--protein-cysteine methyltransferase